MYKSDLDKLSFDDRVKWIKINHENIINLDEEFLMKADEPLLFLAFCFEYKKINDMILSASQGNNNTILSSCLPIQLDATCNGLQHLSIITGNQNLAKLVNLLPNKPENEPYDLYSFTLELIKKKN